MVKKFLIVVPLILIAVIVFIFYGYKTDKNVDSTEGTEKKKVIAVVPKSLDNPFFDDVKKGVYDAAKKLDIEIKWAGPSNTDTDTQVAIIEGLIQERVDGILISVNDQYALKYVIDKAIDAGIKVATFDSDSPGSKRLFYIGTDNYSAGYECGRLLVGLAKKSDRRGEEIHTVILSGDKLSDNLNQRIRGFMDAINGNEIVVDEILYCGDDMHKAVALVGDTTQKKEDLDAWFMVGGWPFYNPEITMSPLKGFKKDGGLVVGIDTFYPVLKFVKSDIADVLVGQNAYAMGEVGVKELNRIIDGGEVEEQIIYTGIEIVDMSNVDEKLKEKSEE